MLSGREGGKGTPTTSPWYRRFFFVDILRERRKSKMLWGWNQYTHIHVARQINASPLFSRQEGQRKILTYVGSTLKMLDSSFNMVRPENRTSWL